jgi:hypothetical protein
VTRWTRWHGRVRWGTILARDLWAETAFRVVARAQTVWQGRRAPPYGARSLDDAITRGADFIRRSQCADGSFRAFWLPPGASTAWITAHAAFVLEGVPELTDVCREAALYLDKCAARRAGWGWNDLVRSDLDSTAQALMVLRRFGIPAPLLAVFTLLATQSPEGGFPTYPPSGPGRTPASGWERPHPDVTLLVVELLRRMEAQAEHRARALAWLETQEPRGAVPSYWSPGPAYGLWAQARAQLATDRTRATAAALLDRRPAPPFLPMLIVAAADAMGPGSKATAAGFLLAQQRRDGSWGCAPCLRLTDWREPTARYGARGRVYRDRRRLFSTIHAVAALSHVRARGCALGPEP